MNRILIIFTVLVCSLPTRAQMKVAYEGKDALNVTTRNNKWVVQHKISEGETMMEAARRFHVPPAMVSDMNNIGYKKQLQSGTALYIPVGAYNMIHAKPTSDFNNRPLFYKVTRFDNLYKIAHMADVSQQQLKEWNSLQGNDISEGQNLFVGWVMFEPMTRNESGSEYPPERTVRNRTARVQRGRQDVYDERGRRAPRIVKDTVIVVRKARSPLDGLPEIEKKYMQQTQMEEVVSEERGSAVFFDMKGSVSGGGTHYAFHDSVAPGSIIKVHNPGTHKVVFVKVLGKLPETKEYHNSIIGISSGAKDELMVTENKAWCELRYAPFAN